MQRRLILIVLLCLMAWATPAAAQTAEGPVVHAVLFYSPTCPHCHTVINETLLPMMEQYGDRLVVIGINITEPGGQALYNASTKQFQVPDELQGVPRLVVGDRFLVGSAQIPQEFPGIVDAQLNGRRRQQHHGLRVVAEVPDRPVGPSVSVPDVVRLVHDDEIEGRRRIEIQKPQDLSALALLSQQ